MIYLPCKDINEANNVLAVLGKLPYDQVATVIARFKSALEEQLQTPHKLMKDGSE